VLRNRSMFAGFCLHLCFKNRVKNYLHEHEHLMALSKYRGEEYEVNHW